MSARSGLGRRAGWGIADQALSSMTNFAASIAVAREVSAGEFGAFGVAFLVYLLAVGLTRAVAAEPYLVRHSATDDDEGDDLGAGSAALGVAALCGVVGAVPIATAAFLLGGPMGAALWPVALLLPLLLVQDIARYVLVGRRDAKRAVASDVAWLVLLVPGFALAISSGGSELRWLVAAWAVAGSIAGLVVLRPGLVPSPRAARGWWSRHGDLAPRFAGEFLAGNGARHLSFVLMGAVAGTAAVGAVRAVQVLFGPYNVAMMGAQLVGVSEAVRVRRESPQRLGRFGDRVSALMAAGALALGVVALLLPDSAGEALFGASWAQGSDLVPFQMVAEACAGIVIGSLLVLRATEAADLSLRARLMVAPLTVLGVLVGAALADARGAMAGLVAAQLVAVVVWRSRSTVALRRPLSPPPAPASR